MTDMHQTLLILLTDMHQTLLISSCVLVILRGAQSTEAPVCVTKADIVFLLDSSGSVGSTNFNKQLDFVKKFANTFDIGPQNVQIGVETFATTPHHQFFMNKYPSKSTLLNAIGHVPYQSGSTHTDLALKYVMDHDFKPAAGDRDHVVNILVVMTDGQSNDRQATITQANKLHGMNIKTFAIGIGSGINRAELGHITTDDKHVFTVSNFDALNTLQEELKKRTCEVDGSLSQFGSWSPCTKSCRGGTRSRYRSCNNPPPGYGGKMCVGHAIETGTCNTQACPTTPSPTRIPVAAVCVYKGRQYTQGQRWQDGCDFNCECTNAQTGYYRCTEICPKYNGLPKQCQLITDVNKPCCKKPYCNFQGVNIQVTGTPAPNMVTTLAPNPLNPTDPTLFPTPTSPDTNKDTLGD